MQHNGRIEVKFGPLGGDTTSIYDFWEILRCLVCRVNSEGPGPFSDLVNITTSEEGIY